MRELAQKSPLNQYVNYTSFDIDADVILYQGGNQVHIPNDKFPDKLKDRSFNIGFCVFSKPEYWGFVKWNDKQKKYVPDGLGHMYFKTVALGNS